jgi:DNA helicase IV
LQYAEAGALAESVLAMVQAMRSGQIRQIAVICHAEQYWEGLLNRLRSSHEPVVVIEQRGEKLPSNQPLLVLARPAHVGGQEFDAVVLVGLEQGLVPARVVGNDALAAAVEQQAYREMYLSITRARFQLLIILSHDASPTAALQDAAKQGLVRLRQGAQQST